jgi:hypothetical protein
MLCYVLGVVCVVGFGAQGGSFISDHSKGCYCIEHVKVFFRSMDLAGIRWSPRRTRIPIVATIRGRDCFAEALHFNDGTIVQTKVPVKWETCPAMGLNMM